MNKADKVKEILDKNEELIFDFSDKIWDFAETGLEEVKSKDLYVKVLEEQGFKVNSKVENLPTAFIAEWGKGYPVIGITSEYDSLPGMSQEAGKVERSISKLTPDAGHGCGHNLLGTAGLGAVLAIKEYLEENKMEGTIVLFGTPSEERDAVKTFMARDGLFDNLDVAFTWHPGPMNQIWTASSLANIIVNFHFKGLTSHAAAAPHLGRSALDAAELMNVGVNFLREHIIPEARVHYAFKDVGGSAPNVVQGTSSLYYFIRAPRLNQAMEIYERVQKIAKGAAMMTETEVEIDFQLALSDYIPNPTLCKVLHESLVEVGVPEYTEEDYEFARSFFKTINETDKEAEKIRITREFGKEKADRMIKNALVDEISEYSNNSGLVAGSTDVGDLSYVVPTAQMLVTTSAMATGLHSWQMTAQGKSSIAKKGMKTAAAAMAVAALKVYEDHSLVDKAKEELKNELGEDGYKCPIPKEVNIRDPKLIP